MSLKLYFAPGACSFVPHTLLETAGEPFEAQMVKLHKDEQKSPEYLAINPHGQVPTLVVDGQPLTQIVAIVSYLDERFPQLGFLPRGGMARAKALETLAWMNNSAHPTFTHVFMPFKFTPDEVAQEAVKQHGVALYGPILDELEGMAKQMQAAGRAFLVGDQFGPVDAYALTLLRWGGYAGYDPESRPALWAHVKKVAALPAVARAIERERLQLNVYKPS